MRVTKLNREKFLAWIGGGVEFPFVEVSGVELSLEKGELALIGSAEVQNFERPPIVVVRNEEEIQDFYAFVSTYVSTYVPFSAFFRVISLLEFDEPKLLLASSDNKISNALVGTVLCQTAVGMASGDFSRVRLTDCLASESFSMAKVLMDGHLVAPGKISQRWQFCKGVIRDEAREQRESDELPFWEVIFQFSGSHTQKFRSAALKELIAPVEILIREGGLSDSLWQSVYFLAPEVGSIREEMFGPRERRARAFTRVVQSKELMGRGVVADFVVGYLAVLLAGGALDYVSVISDLRKIYPTVALWFGFISGIVKGGDVATVGLSLGRHVLRELTLDEDIGSPPACDIAFAELGVLARSVRRVGAMFHSKSLDLVKLELFPGTYSFFSRGAFSSPEDLRDQRIDKLPYGTLAEARRMLARLQNILSSEDKPSSTSFDDLFVSPSGRRKK